MSSVEDTLFGGGTRTFDRGEPDNTRTPCKHDKYVQQIYISIAFQCFKHIFSTHNEKAHIYHQIRVK